MAILGFTTYVQPAPPTPPTLEERFAVLTGAQKLSILDGFSAKILANRLKFETGIPKDLIVGVYREIDEIEEECRSLMREEVILEEEVLDPETGEVITPAVYNDAPTDINELKSLIAVDHEDIFSVVEVGIVIDKMIDYSELDEDGAPIGTQSVYAAEVVK